jgi:hypothetical protein
LLEKKSCQKTHTDTDTDTDTHNDGRHGTKGIWTRKERERGREEAENRKRSTVKSCSFGLSVLYGAKALPFAAVAAYVSAVTTSSSS